MPIKKTQTNKEIQNEHISFSAFYQIVFYLSLIYKFTFFLFIYFFFLSSFVFVSEFYLKRFYFFYFSYFQSPNSSKLTRKLPKRSCTLCLLHYDNWRVRRVHTVHCPFLHRHCYMEDKVVVLGFFWWCWQKIELTC